MSIYPFLTQRMFELHKSPEEFDIYLKARGFGSLLPAEVKPVDASYFREVLSSDPLNGNNAGLEVWTSSISPEPSYALKARGSARILARFARMRGRPEHPSVVALKTAQGGRWVIFGKECWNSLTGAVRRAQWLAAADHVMAGGLPVFLETPAQVVVIPHSDPDGTLRSVLLLNCSLDATPPLKVRLGVNRKTRQVIRWLRPCSTAKPVAGSSRKGDHAWITLPEIESWGLGVILLEKPDRKSE